MIRYIRFLSLLSLYLSAFCLFAQQDQVSFSHKGGFYSEKFDLTLSCNDSSNRIYYTLNGTTPTTFSCLFQSPIQLDSTLYSTSHFYRIPSSHLTYYPDRVPRCIIIRAAVFNQYGQRVSEIYTESFFIASLTDFSISLPIMSLAADSAALFDFDSGIFVPGIHFDTANPAWTGNYYQRGDKWERLVNVEFYDTNNEGINQLAGIRIHGGFSRSFAQKGLKLYARSEYGTNQFRYPFFPQLPLNSYKRLVLHPFVYDSYGAGIQDYVCNVIASNLNVESLASRPVVLFINGEYWGLYFLREKPDERYISAHTNYSHSQVNLISNDWEIESGSDDNWKNLTNLLSDSSLSREELLPIIDSLVDIKCLIDYIILECFVANTDWPNNNVRTWQTPSTSWRWIFFDADNTLYYSDEFNPFLRLITINDTSTSFHVIPRLFAFLCQDRDFKRQFVSRCVDLLGSTLFPQATLPILTRVAQAVAGEIPRQSQRFGIPSNQEAWTWAISKTYEYLINYPTRFREQLYQFFAIDPVPDGPTFSFFLAPNPSTGDHLMLVITSEQLTFEPLSVIDMHGRTCYQDNILLLSGVQTHRLQLALSPGLYFIRLGSRSIKFVRK